MTLAKPQAFSFDAQAWSFDRRAGLPEGVAGQIAEAICAAANLTRGDRLLEIGVGTGEVGSELVARQLRYLGLEVSLSMLTLFGRRLAATQGEQESGHLLRADGNRSWPVHKDQIDALFFSRSAHLLGENHLVAEALRVGRPGAWLILGGVRREPQSVHSRMRREMHRLLVEHGIEARGSGRTWRRLATAFEKRGGRALVPVVAASWQVREAPADSLTSWRNVAGLAGRAVDSEIKASVLNRLARWASVYYGDLEERREASEHYHLQAIQMSATDSSSDF